MKSLLLVDDDLGVLEALKILLEEYDYKVFGISGDKNLIKTKAKKEKPSLILLDILLSGEDGREICHELKLDENTSTIPVISMSARKDLKKSAIESGADDFLPKPFDVTELICKIEKHALN